MSHKDEGLKTRHRQYWKKIEADAVVLDPGIIAISWEDSTIRLHDGYTIGGRIFPMSPAPSLTVNVLTPLSGNGSVSSPISLNIAALANQVPVLANAPITGTGIIGNPLDIDTVALAAALANAVPVAHDATLVGNGTAGAPLSVNWGLAPAPTIAHNGTLSGAGTVASPLAVVPNALASMVAVSAISPITGDGKVATPLTLNVPAMLPQLHGNIAVITDGTTITGSGTTANPLVAVPATPVVVTSAPVTGNGTLANPIDINIVSAIAEIAAAGGVPVTRDGSMLGNGTTGNPLGVDWSQQPALNVQHDGSMTGQGTAGNPLSVNWASAPAINVQHDGTMTGSGTAGSPLSVNGLALASQVPVSVNAGLSGNGTAGSPIAINPGVLGPMLSGLVPIAVSAPLTGVGTAASPLGITNASGALRGVVQLATAAEGLQPANDSDAATPAYIAAAVTDAIASLPNKHVPAIMNSPLNSISVTAGGTDNQTFTIDTNANLVSIQDAGNYFTGTTIEAALQEIGAQMLPYATTAEIQAGHPDKVVTADDLAAALDAGVDHRIFVNKTSGATAAFLATHASASSANTMILNRSGGDGTTLVVNKTGAGSGSGFAGFFYNNLSTPGGINGVALYGQIDGVANGHGTRGQRSGTADGSGVYADNTSTGTGFGLYAYRSGGSGDALQAYKDGAEAGNGVTAYRTGAGAGDGLVAYRIGAGLGAAINAQSLTGHGLVANSLSNVHAGIYAGNAAFGVATQLAGSDLGVGWGVHTTASMFAAGTYNSSDERLKENIEPITGALDLVRHLSPVSHTWKPWTTQFKHSPGKQLGLIAQQVQQILPEIVAAVSYPVGPAPSDPGKFIGNAPVEVAMPEGYKAFATGRSKKEYSEEDIRAFGEYAKAEADAVEYAAKVAEAEAKLPEYEKQCEVHKEALAKQAELGEILAVNYVPLIPVLLAAVAELADRVEKLEGK